MHELALWRDNRKTLSVTCIGVLERSEMIALVETLSKELKESLPTVEDTEAEFGKEKD
jgi:hypothetical protein